MAVASIVLFSKLFLDSFTRVIATFLRCLNNMRRYSCSLHITDSGTIIQFIENGILQLLPQLVSICFFHILRIRINILFEIFMTILQAVRQFIMGSMGPSCVQGHLKNLALNRLLSRAVKICFRIFIIRLKKLKYCR